VTRAGRWLLLGAPLALAVVFAVAWLLVDLWLESAGGRQAVERALAERIGLPVRLEGDFRVMLLPSIGVSGTGLVVGAPSPASELARSEEYAVSLALGPLLDGRLSIESVRFSGGILRLAHWPAATEAPDTAAQAPLVLPDVRALEISEFRVIAGEDETEPYLLRHLSIEDFTAGRATPFRLQVEGFGDWSGSLTWLADHAELLLVASGSGNWPGELRLRTEALLDTLTGALEVRWAGAPTAALRTEPQLTLAYAWLPAGLRIRDLRLAADAVRVQGAGCFLTGDRPALHLDLSADRVDVDALPEWSALSSDGPAEDAGQPAAGWPDGLDFNVRLSVGELLAGGAVARQAVLRLGGEPDCLPVEDAAVN